jgi:hypothetical protein
MSKPKKSKRPNPTSLKNELGQIPFTVKSNASAPSLQRIRNFKVDHSLVLVLNLVFIAVFLFAGAVKIGGASR